MSVQNKSEVSIHIFSGKSSHQFTEKIWKEKWLKTGTLKNLTRLKMNFIFFFDPRYYIKKFCQIDYWGQHCFSRNSLAAVLMLKRTKKFVLQIKRSLAMKLAGNTVLSKFIIYKSRGEPFLWNRIWDLGWLWAGWQWYRKCLAQDAQVCFRAVFMSKTNKNLYFLYIVFSVRTKKLHNIKMSKGAFTYDVRCFGGTFDLPTYLPTLIRYFTT